MCLMVSPSDFLGEDGDRDFMGKCALKDVFLCYWSRNTCLDAGKTSIRIAEHIISKSTSFPGNFPAMSPMLLGIHRHLVFKKQLWKMINGWIDGWIICPIKLEVLIAAATE